MIMKEGNIENGVVLVGMEYYVTVGVSIIEDTTYYVKVQRYSRKEILRTLKQDTVEGSPARNAIL